MSNPPDDWEPDVLMRQACPPSTEPMGITDNPLVKVDVEKNVVDLDPEGGTPTTDNVLEVRADSAGKLEVGPIDIDVVLQDNTQVVTVEFKASGHKHDGSERPVVRFQWKFDDQSSPRYWEILQVKLITRLYTITASLLMSKAHFSAGAWRGQDHGHQAWAMARLWYVPSPDEAG